MPNSLAYTLEPGQPSPGPPSLLRPPIAIVTSTGILTRFPSTTLFSLALGVDLPCPDERWTGTLGLSAGRFFTPLVVTHVSIRTCDTSSMLYNTPSQAYTTLPYPITLKCHCRSFGVSLSPVTSSAQADSTSELLRFL